MFISNEWKDYILMDANNGSRLEQWGEFVLERPDPSAFWDIPQFAHEHVVATCSRPQTAQTVNVGADIIRPQEAQTPNVGGDAGYGVVATQTAQSTLVGTTCGRPQMAQSANINVGAEYHPPAEGTNHKNSNIKIDATYSRSTSGGGSWKFNCKLPEKWTISYKDMKFWVKPMGFKHTGIFPEQATNWDFIREHLQKSDKVLNLFAYTGGATVASAKAGAEIVHVDASKGIIQMAKENAELNGLKSHPIRYIIDDCSKFVAREIRRGNKYDAIILDPPSYGRGTNGEVWKIEDNLADLLALCKQVLSPNAKFVLVNSYTTGLSVGSISALAQMIFGGKIESAELGLPVKNRNIILPSGSAVRIVL